MPDTGPDLRTARLVSFVHGYRPDAPVPPDIVRPALWIVGDGARDAVRALPFPVAPADFARVPLSGEVPRSTDPFESAPRFGLTGLARRPGVILAACWNGIWELDARDATPRRFLSNRFTCYLHRIAASPDRIIGAMPFLDLVVEMDPDGRVLDRYVVTRSLRLDRSARSVPDDVDFRFVSKPWAGPTGHFHFNAVHLHGESVFLLSRNLSALIEIRPGARRARLHAIALRTPACLHDGDVFEDRFHFTSIDGKILIAAPAPRHDRRRFRSALPTEVIRLGERERNWCRGLAVDARGIHVTVDGRYDTELSFGLLHVAHAGRPAPAPEPVQAAERDLAAVVDERRFRWTRAGAEDALRFVTGFDILLPEPPLSAEADHPRGVAGRERACGDRAADDRAGTDDRAVADP
ncbi:MAG: hypothetical protein KF817_12390 [Phycisphaeraceae bacterium]|nr:hypothetical protein [Phycisphaeraceae bacterium]